MKKRNLYTLIMCLVILIILIIIILSSNLNENKNKVCFDKNCFNIEVVSTPKELSKGLMFRESLEKDSGMLFIFPENGIYSFWMKNTLIPLDIIWINLDEKIVFIKNNAQPCQEDNCESFTPNETAKYILELNSGIAEKTGLEIGNKLDIKIN